MSGPELIFAGLALAIASMGAIAIFLALVAARSAERERRLRVKAERRLTRRPEALAEVKAKRAAVLTALKNGTAVQR